MQPSRVFVIGFAALAMVVLSGCSDVRSALGIGKKAPDEFAVVRRAPLSLPPDYAVRPPPQPGIGRPQEQAVPEQARQTVFKADPPKADSPALIAAKAKSEGRSAGEVAFSTRAGAAEANPGIRQLVNQESSQLAVKDETFVESMMFWREDLPAGTVVDPLRESQRLRENQALGRPLNEGETPTIVEKRRRVSLF